MTGGGGRRRWDGRVGPRTWLPLTLLLVAAVTASSVLLALKWNGRASATTAIASSNASPWGDGRLPTHEHADFLVTDVEDLRCLAAGKEHAADPSRGADRFVQREDHLDIDRRWVDRVVAGERRSIEGSVAALLADPGFEFGEGGPEEGGQLIHGHRGANR